MSTEPLRSSPPEPDDTPTPEEWVPADDRVIGRVFRWSLVVLAGALAIGALLWWVLQRPEGQGAVATITTAPPVAAPTLGVPPTVELVDRTAAAGLDFVHFTGARGDKLLPETMGGGGGFLDLDGDGDQDLILVNGTDWAHDPPRGQEPALVLFLNDGKGNFVRDRSAPTDRYYGMGVTFGDFDGDGRRDVFVTAVGRNHLYRNVDGMLVDVTQAAGVAGSADEWSTGAAFFDLEGDGDLDLFVANYVRWSKAIDFEISYQLTGVGKAYGPPLNYEGTYSYLYRNEGDGTFSDISATSGIRVDNPATGLPAGKALTVVPVDVDRDGHMDLFVANDTVRNFLFHNRGDGRFEETAELWGLAYDRQGSATGAMGTDFGDFRNDGELGFLIGNFANEMTSVYVSQGDPTLFADEAIPEGIGAPTRTALSFGLLLLDYDLDGRLDLLQNNGHLEDEIAQVDPSQSYQQRPQLFWNAGPDSPRTFVPAAATAGLERALVGRGSTYADIDGDGDLDPLLLQVGGPPVLLVNDQDLGHHWVRLELVGRVPNRDALGARVELTAGGITQSRTVMPTRSYLSQVELPLTFGLGPADAVESLVVTWPDGTVQPVEDLRLDALNRIEQSP